MRRTLSERLREDGWTSDLACSSDVADAIEDECLPLPCDSEGRPWHLGDEFLYDALEGTLRFEVDGVRHVTNSDDCVDHWALVAAEDGRSYNVADCRRPDPEALDGNGSPIKVGATVWRVDGSCMDTGEVVGFDGPGLVLVRWEMEAAPCRELGINILASRPAFDADGERLKPQDAVWSVYGDHLAPYDPEDLMIVQDVRSHGVVLVERALGGAPGRCVDGEALTHYKPVFDADGNRLKADSLVRLVADPLKGVARVTRAGNDSVDIVFPEGERLERLDGAKLTQKDTYDIEALVDVLASSSRPENGYSADRLRSVMREVADILAEYPAVEGE